MRQQPVPEGIFKPKPTAIETKQDATTRAARQIIDGEAAERERKTERLRQARLAMQAVEAASPAARSPAKKRTGRRKQA
ncbi:hypothetical protein EN858_11190 [Mesorhizobium sp. M4B.F.Ca.ET.215.01.1.1]|uniref:hypothetical protein n=1 Tax=Mesorhizobium TaxID=68287 RepID=UPI000FCC8C25|nr:MULTISPECIES: hypothetical protein [unclassified Mesorhizobium]MDX8433679.1 hypothetical protein [Mesorhizobium abyssinicae]RUW20311.1 hypothetical protein EOA34_27405 [Mesorhizobium sp. M4B.F.Ca.ET.013.02.1.1]RUW65728.1 hypothetical protein EOA31_33045 [Mesorhizobium sp. M4B.F.Ca.ET.049.02.1.2]RVD27077.1 hypothetical protein EN738_12340 [Mesorhizobium sp. M4B.F.Ca.ET.017.02.2.1]RVD33942.1 hypothetical protein EN741_31045 [Mesorhizobium sp. M4B.F.Ca.ET.019.03.1.1]RVD65972.1 hypothetical pr